MSGVFGWHEINWCSGHNQQPGHRFIADTGLELVASQGIKLDFIAKNIFEGGQYLTLTRKDTT